MRLRMLAFAAAGLAALFIWQPFKTTAAVDSLTGKSDFAIGDDRAARFADVTRPETVAPYRAGSAGHIVGVVVDPGGQPIDGALCVLSPGAPAWGFDAPEAVSAGERRQALSDTAGAFSFPVAEGVYRLEVHAHGFGPASADHLVAGDDREVRLRPTTQLVVQVNDVDGVPLAGARVELLDSFRLINSTPLRVATTDAEGRALLEGTAGTDNYLSLVHPGIRYGIEIVEVNDSDEFVHVDLVASHGTRLHGRVSAGPGRPALVNPRVRVEAYSRGQTISLDLACDEGGNYSTEALFAAGETIRLTAGATGLGDKQTWTIVSMDDAGGQSESNFILAEDERLARGRTVDAQGNGLSAIDVYMASTEPFGQDQNALVSGLMQVPRYRDNDRCRRLVPSGSAGRRLAVHPGLLQSGCIAECARFRVDPAR